jgi:hypothetical protein
MTPTIEITNVEHLPEKIKIEAERKIFGEPYLFKIKGAVSQRYRQDWEIRGFSDIPFDANKADEMFPGLSSKRKFEPKVISGKIVVEVSERPLETRGDAIERWLIFTENAIVNGRVKGQTRVSDMVKLVSIDLT